jgi:hypothetical protein
VKLEKEKTLDISLGFSWEMKEHEVLKFDESGFHELEERERVRERLLLPWPSQDGVQGPTCAEMTYMGYSEELA